MAGSISGRSIRLLSTKGLLLALALSARAANTSAISSVDSAVESAATSTIDSTADSTGISTTDSTADSTVISSASSTSRASAVSTATSISKSIVSTNGAGKSQSSDASSPCKSYVVASGDTCEAIAKSNGISSSDLTDFNAETWGWTDCDHIMSGLKICVGEGAPPVPAPVDGALCGPLKPNSAAPTAGQSLAEMNPCPNNACCTATGLCGFTPDFCIASNSSNSGCISNCGTEITKDDAPSDFLALGYYQSWAYVRKRCPAVTPADLDTSKLTHLLWSFVQVNQDLTIQITDQNQWPAFMAVPNVKKVVAVGGWTHKDTFKLAALPENQDKVANNLKDFVNEHNLDGVDIDWEFPDDATEGHNMLTFLQKIRQTLPSEKTLSFDIPAAYKPLDLYDLEGMAKTADWVGVMTYDYHDYTEWNKTKFDGCPGLGCVRSHVNLTETQYTLAAVTKAGIPLNKIVAGVSSYGKSFVLTNGDCIDPSCTFEETTPPMSRCVDDPSPFFNYELNEKVKANTDVTKAFHDDASDSDILVWKSRSETIWTGWMNDDTKAHRKSLYKEWGLLGTMDWALDMDL